MNAYPDTSDGAGVEHDAAAFEPATFEDAAPGHPSQAEGEDPELDGAAADPRPAGHPSQAEGDDD